MKIKRKWVYIPIETKAREFLGKLLLACFLAENGFGVVIGEREKLKRSLIWLPAGIYMEKGIGFTGEQKYLLYKKMGHKIVAFEEEGLIFNKIRREKTFCHKCFKLTDTYLAWGKNEYDFIHNITKTSMKKVKIVGNVRFDLLRPELRSIFDDEDIISTYKP